MDFLRSHLIMNVPLSVDHFQPLLFGGFAVTPNNSDEWKWSTEKDVFMIK